MNQHNDLLKAAQTREATKASAAILGGALFGLVYALMFFFAI